jgi:hypothetical protein
MSELKKKRVYTDPTKSQWQTRCMAAENTVRQQDIELTTQRQGRAKFELAANRLQDEVDRLRRWLKWWPIAAGLIGYVIGIVIGRAIQ